MISQGKRLVVYVMKTNEVTQETTWQKGGSAWLNRDGSINVYLDVLPLDGRLHIREESTTAPATPPTSG